MHSHVSQVAGSHAELAGDRLRYGGGNFGVDLLGGNIGSVGTGSTYLITSPVGGSDSIPGTLGGNLSALTRVVIHIAAFWILSIAVLILLHKAGFRFSLSV